MKSSESLPPDVVDALNQGQWIDAIKRLRAAQNLDLKGAKEAVDSYLKSHPEATARIKEQWEDFFQRVRKWLWIAAGVGALLFWKRFNP